MLKFLNIGIIFKFNILLLIFILNDTLTDCQLYEGDSCTTRVGEYGLCKEISNCSSVLNDLSQGNRNHVLCGYRGFLQIVCCPTIAPAATNITTTHRPNLNRISAKKCNEYKELAYNKIFVTTISGPTIEKKVSNCSFLKAPLIVGGTEAFPKEFPHMALIGFDNHNDIQWSCGGTLISEQFVLSAAHCMDSQDYGPAKYVRLGEHDLYRTDDATPIDFNIIDRILHPDYRYPMHYNDIGLFKLERNVEFNAAIRPACLPEVSPSTTKKAIATGWGVVSWKRKQSNVLLKVILDVFSQDECNTIYRTDKRKLNKGIIEETQLCSGSHTEEKDSCQGDSGGPLQIYHDTYHCTYTIVGVTSFGKPCGTIGTPGVYTLVFTYLDWIENIVWPNQ